MTSQPVSTSVQWWPIAVGYVLAVVVGKVVGVQLQVLNLVAAAAVALVIGGLLVLGASTDGRRADPPTGTRPQAPPQGGPSPPPPAGGPPSEVWSAHATGDDPFDATGMPAAATGSAGRFDWHPLVADVWKQDAQCARCAEPLARATDPCPSCGQRTPSTSTVRITTSGPFLDAIHRLPSTGGSDV